MSRLLLALVSLASWKKGDAKKDVYRFFIREISLEEVQGSTSHHESRTYIRVEDDWQTQTQSIEVENSSRDFQYPTRWSPCEAPNVEGIVSELLCDLEQDEFPLLQGLVYMVNSRLPERPGRKLFKSCSTGP